MLHEALHAKLIAEYYDEVRNTNFLDLYANYKGENLLGLDKEQEKTMLHDYISEMAKALKDFDETQGISKTLDFYEKAIKYDLDYEINGKGSSQEDYEAYNKMVNSSKTCK